MSPTLSERARLRDEVVAFYAYETALLDDGNYHEWLDLLEDDIRYVLPARELREGDIPEAELELPTFYLFNDDKETLTSRVARLDTGLALVATPPPSRQRLVTDVLLLEVGEHELKVRSSFFVYEARDAQTEAFFIGRRVDRLRRRDDAFRIARRDIQLAQYILPRAIPLFL